MCLFGEPILQIWHENHETGSDFLFFGILRSSTQKAIAFLISGALLARI